jgi:hypothetical protein
MQKKTEIVFIHQGYSWHLPYALSQARFISPTSPITLIGDDAALKAARGIQGIRCQKLDELESAQVDQFSHNYVHMSSNTKDYECFCWQRWFYLLELMRKYQLTSVMYLDSDVLLYSALPDLVDIYTIANKSCGFLIPQQNREDYMWCASGHISFWDVASLEALCEFSLRSFSEQRKFDIYKEKYDWHLSQQISGGICDMTTLYLFWLAHQDQIFNLAINIQGHVFDNNLNTSANYYAEEYVRDEHQKIKKVKFINNRPFLFSTDTSGLPIQVHGLHFQGAAKKYIRQYYCGNHRYQRYFNYIRDYLTDKYLRGRSKLSKMVKPVQ